MNGFASLRTRLPEPTAVRRVERHCLLCGAVLRNGNGGAICRPCLLPKGQDLRGRIPEWAAGLVEHLTSTNPQVKNVAGLCFSTLAWKGNPQDLHRAIIRRVPGGISACARELDVTRQHLHYELTHYKALPLMTVLAISRALGDRV